MKLSTQELQDLKLILIDSIELLRKEKDQKIETIRSFKWLCHNYLPQHGDKYIKNINVFEIQDKTIKDLETSFDDKNKLLMKIINNQ